ncbi:hemolysin family protein [Saliterribacillus persicus]|uniref:Putative hemolysin n=1 Tax=Saliterribacillus persicus TaxID=930114 RepID=A0A368YAB6_9BACI|nr:hemolysin family protein [Saliterribacillus persicus]RCW77201.1 putative hemolysin [Saliterribacillus persicus]
MGIEIVILIVLILVNAFFAASEIALVALNDNKVKKMAEQGDKKAIMLDRLLAEPGRFLATIQIGITLAGFLASAFAADNFADPLSESLHALGIPLSIGTLRTISVVVITILLSYFTLVIGELVPKQLALQKAVKVANFTVKPLTFLFKISRPFVKLLNGSTNLIVKLFGVDPNAKQDEATEEEIRMLVDIGGEKGTIEADEKLMIHNIFEFNDKEVADIMTHRTDMTSIPIDAPFEEVAEIVNTRSFTRFPVYKYDLDHIVGILHTKDLSQFLHKDPVDFDLYNLVRKAFFLLESQSIDIAFSDMQKNKVHIAMVVDEYGGIDGMITMEDIIEEIVGEIYSEHEETVEQDEIGIKKIDEYTLEVKGTTQLHDLEDYIKEALPLEDFETINGLFVHTLGYIPKKNEKVSVVYKGLEMKALEVSDNRIEKILIKQEPIDN